MVEQEDDERDEIPQHETEPEQEPHNIISLLECEALELVRAGDIQEIQHVKFHSLKSSARLCTTAIHSKQMLMFYYLRSAGYSWDEDTIAAASFIDNTDLVKELYYAHCPIDSGVYWHAIRNLNDGLADWVIEMNLPHADLH